MQQLAGKTAFITGAASGIGLALATAFAGEGMKVMLADIESAPLDRAVEALRASGAEVRGVVCDVADPVSMDDAADAAFRAFGNVHVLCNNAGVAAGGGIEQISIESWRWVIDVNLMGVVHGIKSFLPHIRRHGEGGHIVNTASMGGMNAGLGFSPYSASKFAVVSMSEGLAWQLAPDGIGVSVLCPSYVRTRIGESGRNRPERYGPTPELDPAGPSRRSRSGWRPGSILRWWRREFFPRSARIGSTFSPIPACGPRSKAVLRRFWPQSMRFPSNSRSRQ